MELTTEKQREAARIVLRCASKGMETQATCAALLSRYNDGPYREAGYAGNFIRSMADSDRFPVVVDAGQVVLERSVTDALDEAGMR